MPGSLSQLSRLQNLILKHCKSLQSLPELPSSIETLDCDDCTSLESFSCPSRAYASRRSGGFTFKFSNCFRIMENELQSDVLEAIVLGIQLVASITKFLDPQQVSFCLFTLSEYLCKKKKWRISKEIKDENKMWVHDWSIITLIREKSESTTISLHSSQCLRILYKHVILNY